MAESKALRMPVSKGTILSKNMLPKDKEEQEFMENVLYAEDMGNLMYAMTSIRLDICHVVWLISRYQSNPGKAYWQAIKRIFRYLQGTKGMKLCFGISDLEVIGYTDANFTGDVDDRKSTSGHVFLFGGTIVSWLCKKQSCVAKYTMEAEYISCSTAISEAV